MKNELLDLKLSSADCEAILAAFPILTAPEFDISDEQAEINLSAVKSASQKLVFQNQHFTSNEIRVISLAVICAKEYLQGKMPLELPSDFKSEISSYFFNYNKMAPIFSEALDRLSKQYGQDN